MDELMFKIVELVVVIAVIVITRYVVPYIKTQISSDQLQTVEEYAVLAVRTAEQIMGDHSGEEKKVYVVNLINSFCTNRNISITQQQINTLIEAAVNTIKAVQA